MKKNQIVFLGATLIVALSLSISSCGDKKNQTPVITLEEPADGESIAVSDSLHIEGSLSDDESLHEAAILVIKSTGDTTFQNYPMVHDLKSYDFHYHFHPTATGTYTVKVVAEDHKELSSEKSVSVTVTP